MEQIELIDFNIMSVLQPRDVNIENCVIYVVVQQRIYDIEKRDIRQGPQQHTSAILQKQ